VEAAKYGQSRHRDISRAVIRHRTKYGYINDNAAFTQKPSKIAHQSVDARKSRQPTQRPWIMDRIMGVSRPALCAWSDIPSSRHFLHFDVRAFFNNWVVTCRPSQIPPLRHSNDHSLPTVSPPSPLLPQDLPCRFCYLHTLFSTLPLIPLLMYICRHSRAMRHLAPYPHHPCVPGVCPVHGAELRTQYPRQRWSASRQAAA
jgi:hypothetical protein